HKLSHRVSSLELLEIEIEKLIQEGLLDNRRFAEQYVHSRENRGLGPIRIEKELRERGVERTIIEELLSEKNWIELAKKALLKKTRKSLPREKEQILKLKKFLNYRGFSYIDIEGAFKLVDGSSNL
ncbi:uncharacterized protein METZ01_LOCUS453872, partial [marine metagenome]